MSDALGLNAFVLPAIKASIVLTVFAVGLSATLRDALHLFRHPGLLTRTIVSMNVFMPLLALWLAVAFRLHPAVKVALVTLAMSPVPPMLPNRIRTSGGEQAYNIGVLTTSALLSVIIIPLSLWAMSALLSLPLDVSAGTIAKLVAVTVLVPLGVGIAVNRFAPGTTARIRSPVSLIAMLLLIVSFIPVLIRMWPAVTQLVGNGTLAAIVAMTVAGLAIGHLMGGPTRSERAVLAQSTASRHPAVAIAVAAAAMPNERLAPVAVLLALIVGAIVSLPYTVWEARKNRKRVTDSAP